MLTVYSKNHCPFCDKAVALLKMKNVDHTVIKIDEGEDDKGGNKQGHDSRVQSRTEP